MRGTSKVTAGGAAETAWAAWDGLMASLREGIR